MPPPPQVHSYGGCLRNRDEEDLHVPLDPTWPEDEQRRARKMYIMKHYKFNLAFENDPLDDYVTEKVGGWACGGGMWECGLMIEHDMA